ncbi:MAG TPA: transcription-repair coupling factor [Microbacteriaceae bacterium]|nr:transcription-repair coupling factor [Microbacteriaceae bacterium]
MTLHGLFTALQRASDVQELHEAVERDTDAWVPDGLIPGLAAGLSEGRAARGHAGSVLIITATSREAEQLASALRSATETPVLTMPAWETLPHERLSPSAETVGRRIQVVRAVATGEPTLVIASVRAALQPVAGNLASIPHLEFQAGARGYDLSVISAQLVELAFERVDLVTRRGEFAVRGGILDVFPPTEAHPLRIEFFGDEIEHIKPFNVADQRSLAEAVERVDVLPSRELLLTPAVRQRAREMRHEFPQLAQILEKVSEGIPAEGMESLAPALLDELVPLTAFFPRGSAVVVVKPEKVAARAQSLGETNREFLAAAWSAATIGGTAPIDTSSFASRLAAGEFLDLEALRLAHRAADDSANWWTFLDFDSDAPGTERTRAHGLPSFAGNADGALDFVAERLRADWSVVVAIPGHGLVERAAQLLSERTLAARIVDEIPTQLDSGVAYLATADVLAGFEHPELRVCVLSEADFFGRARSQAAQAPKKLASRRRSVVDPLQLKPGDLVVHETHGIGRFVELVSREVTAGVRPSGPARVGEDRSAPTIVREYVVLEYAPSKRGQAGDRLFVPTDQLDLLTRYVGGEAPTLSKMGGSDWAAAKGKARKAVRDIAVELVKLYSARMSSKGHAFGPDTPWQRELEEAFPHVETLDQLQTIEEIKADMERPIPMDRLLAGDVGFGKTEVAVRAAFKAIQDGTQVAMLVPTTLLVKQHLETFSERYAGFPVKLRALSRFQTDKEARETIAGLADGSVDMVIGTHRILTEKMQFKNLGLLIIDEEQRFGVEHKDALKKLKTNVDILAMSATPIPRTLEMAVTGIREMSTLATPPEDRHPILTYVGPSNDQQVAAAIRRELLREGQVFFVHNRVSSINRVASHIAELVPEARIAVAHGQLGEHQLEDIVDGFWERRFDVLVSTTIIETGLDIANANTIIIDRADKYGLSQLHQLRGRVGRGRERAYAYFLYDDSVPLSETAHDRLSTIAANNELGSGMQVALKDLEIRGAGNLLGAEQAGHIAGVGFDLYLRMIGEAVSMFRGDVAEGQIELRLELPVDAHIPEEYVESERLRLEAYQKLSAASAPAAADEAIGLVREELLDRYGAPPVSVDNLFHIATLRRHAAKANLSEVAAVGPKLRVSPANLPDSRRVRLERLYPGTKFLAATDTALIPLPEGLADADMIAWARQLLEAVWPLEP